MSSFTDQERSVTSSAAVGSTGGARRGGWKPEALLRPPPVFVWPPRPAAFLRWFFGYPGYLWPWNAAYTVIALLTWLYLTPDLARMRSFEPGWIAQLFVV